ncbi:MAG: biotin--[Clostridia bacterium]|nr:biotin--[acetyl-CoA-carboxylase] ligase [Clostridia bacterium]
MADTLTKEAILSRLHTATFGQNLQVIASTASTNTDLRRLAADGAPEGTTLIAVTQTGGRGRRGRSFFSPNGGIYLSTLLRPTTADIGQITSCAAVAAARAIERVCPLQVGIKWVNDLYIDGRKVCGILAEGELDTFGKPAYILLGFGINVAPCEMPDELKNIATSLGNLCAPPSRAALAAALLEEWEAAYITLSAEEILAESRRRSILTGRAVTVLRGEESFPATVLSITDEGHLLVRTATGDLPLTSGEVSLRL